ncbi:similar to Saccharomyces cerevisiae YFL042C Putative protein of unknown function [Maudiozyma saulgeensis]|uniref:VASt domain-containing protein n=1 Tax=Maudiozyma saulgeensis TaxID=1789683 RepID=A0A1X7QYX2_9SACH|nr:similar to Saccharomyces cerevisiae YFL042C Putative protein of unknown function [Kazachstania saulgeensis]
MPDIDDWEPVPNETENNEALEEPFSTEEKRNIPKQLVVDSDGSEDVSSSSPSLNDNDKVGSIKSANATSDVDTDPAVDHKEVNDEKLPLMVDTNLANDEELVSGDVKPENGLQSPSFLNNMFSTFRSYSQSNDNNSVTSPTGTAATSPNIISHRRQSSSGSRMRHSSLHSASNSVTSSPKVAPQSRSSRVNSMSSVGTTNTSKSFKDLRPMETISTINSNNVEEPDDRSSPSPQLDYNPKKFVEEKYLDTQYHYASLERDKDFHTLFTSIPKHDRLIDDFSCALSREFLYQGRIYITQTHLGFNSNILGWTSKVILEFKDITYMEKTSSAGVFQNAISIETEEGKTQFINFISRDGCFGLMKEVWSRNLLAHEEEKRRSAIGIALPETSPNNSNNPHSLIDTYSELIHSPDSKLETSIKTGNSSEGNISDHSLVKNTLYTTTDGFTATHTEKVLNIYKFKESSPYNEFDFKPHVLKPTQFPFYPPNENKNEHILIERTVSCTPNQAFQMIFNAAHHEFLQSFLLATDSRDIKLPESYVTNEQTGNLERQYNYSKSISGIPGGSTDCIVTEEIIHNDPDNYIMVINTTKTPNVPSGGAFSTKTRYLFKWGVDNSCDLLISFWVDWTGSSWIKPMVEAGCKNGQTDATTKMMKILDDLIEKYIFSEVVIVEADEENHGVSEKDIERNIEENDARQEAIKVQNALKNQTSGTSESNGLINVLLVFIAILLLWNIYNQRSLNSSISSLQRAVDKLQMK